MAETTHNPCCSSHGVDMTCERYRRTHFVEVGRCCAHDQRPDRPTPPPLELRCPDCSICGEETNPSPDRTFDCSDCQVSWPYTGNGPEIGDGEWDDPDADRCASTTTSTWWPEGSSARCLLTAGHGRHHYGPSGMDPTVLAYWTATEELPVAAAPVGEEQTT